MALSEDRIIDLFNEACRETFNGLERFRYFARAIEAEVLKRDEALIQQLVEALEGYRRNHNDTQPSPAAQGDALDADLTDSWSAIYAARVAQEGKSHDE